MRGRVAFLIFLITLPGCTVGPDYERPQTGAQTVSGYINAPEESSAETMPISRWWERLGDPAFKVYVDQLLESNLELVQAQARVKQAWAARGVASGELYPSLSSNASWQRDFRPAQDFSTVAGGSGGAISGGGNERVYNTSITAQLSTSWQIDLFGKIRRNIASAQASALAAEAEKQATIHALIAELVQAKVALAALSERRALVKEIIQTRERTLSTVDRRYKSGTSDINAEDVYLARQNLSSIQAELPRIEQSIKEQAYTIDLLLGQPPGTTNPLATGMDLNVPERNVPAGVPAYLLDRRPDLRGAELRVVAATNDIGVAVANLYPDLSLSGNLGFENDSTNDLFTADRLVGSILGSIMTRIFEGGSLRAQIDLEEAQAVELAAAYADQVLTAMREVEVGLSNERQLNQVIAELEESVKSVCRAEELAQGRYERGLGSLITLLEAQQRCAQAQQELISARETKWLARVSLYLALGGDWFTGDNQIKTTEG